jgi:Flp pilus assembly protein TadD
VAGRPREAERVFREDLALHPGNGWALYGLAESLRRQGRSNEAERVREQFRAAWSRADLARPDTRY